MNELSILLFFAYTYCTGLIVTSFVKNSENFLERNLMRIGFGLSIVPLIGLILNLLHVPIDWRIMLLISAISTALYYFIRKPKFHGLLITKYDITIAIMLIIFGINLYIYTSGAFNYPYLEDDDSWSHALGAKYVSVEKTVFSNERIFHYMDPYPPTYDLLMGLLHQTNDSIYFTLKFFNALIISLSIIFFYFFVKELTQNRNKALLAAFALASVPAFMSHFIWALSLTVPLYFVCFYSLEKIKQDKKWWIVSGICMATALTSSPTHSTYFGFFFVLYLLTKMALERKLLPNIWLSGLLGAALSFIFWWFPMIMKYGFIGTLNGVGLLVSEIKSAGIGAVFSGTGDRIYTASDFFIAQKENMINNPVGIGLVLCILVIISIFFTLLKFKKLTREENKWIVLTLVWFMFTLYAVNASRFTIKLSPFRAWMLFAIPVCILAAEGAFVLLDLLRHIGGNGAKYVMLAIILAGIFYTSGQQKIAINTANWPPGAFWASYDEINGYVWMKDNIPPGSSVFTFYNNAPIIGMDKYTCHWCPDVRDYMKSGFNETIDQTHSWLKSHDYDFIVIDSQTANKFGMNQTNDKVQSITSSSKFKATYGNNGFVIFQIL